MVQLSGRIVVPGDPDYDISRLNFNIRYNKCPLVIVFVSNTQDVSNAVLWSRENNIPLRIRSGRHDFEAFSNIDNGLIIDLSNMSNVTIDKNSGLARVEAGRTLKDIYEILWRDGFTIPAGTGPTVGLTGLALGGGIGYLTRSFGLTSDNIVSLEIIDAMGRLIIADEVNNSDLLWASRGGGGGNFGVVTALTFKIHPISTVAYYQASWPLSDLENVINIWQDWAPFTDNRLSTILNITKDGISSIGLFTGHEDDLRNIINPLITGVINLDIKTVPYISFIRTIMVNDPSIPKKFKNTGAFVYQRISPSGIGILRSFIESSMGEESIQLSSLGGIVGEISSDHTAFFYRQALFAIQYMSSWENDFDAEGHINWVRDLRKFMTPYTFGTYVNWKDLDIIDWPQVYYGTNLQCLRQIKAKYDPDNIFNFPQSIV